MWYFQDEIKEAFWKTFHKSGEQWFDYLGTDLENEESTASSWDEFLYNLQTASKRENEKVVKHD